MAGELVGDTVVVKDQTEGTQHYNKGNFGYPRRGGGLDLDLVEALFLLECDRLEVLNGSKRMTFEDLMEHSSSMDIGLDVKYQVYRDLRQRGFVVRSESGTFELSVYPRGKNVSNSSPLYFVKTVSERSTLDVSDFLKELSDAEAVRRKLMYGVVDEEGDVTYYTVSKRVPRGAVIEDPDEQTVAKGRFIGDMVLVMDNAHAECLRQSGFYGKNTGRSMQLSLIECCYLSSTGELSVLEKGGKEWDVKELTEFGREGQNEFDLRLAAFKDLRSKGLVVKTGFKYGAHFRVYEDSPDECHARYLVHAVPPNKTLSWPEVSRTVRLSGGVKKEILFGIVSVGVEYLEFKWFKP